MKTYTFIFLSLLIALPSFATDETAHGYTTRNREAASRADGSTDPGYCGTYDMADHGDETPNFPSADGKAGNKGTKQ